MSDTIPVTVAVPVKNEAKNLPRCLERLGRFQQVVVIDSGSTDGTQNIARAHGAEVVQFEWNGKFPKKRNWYLDNHPPDTEWVLFLDADEFITNAFCDEVAAVVAADEHAEVVAAIEADQRPIRIVIAPAGVGCPEFHPELHRADPAAQEVQALTR